MHASRISIQLSTGYVDSHLTPNPTMASQQKVTRTFSELDDDSSSPPIDGLEDTGAAIPKCKPDFYDWEMTMPISWINVDSDLQTSKVMGSAVGNRHIADAHLRRSVTYDPQTGDVWLCAGMYPEQPEPTEPASKRIRGADKPQSDFEWGREWRHGRIITCEDPSVPPVIRFSSNGQFVGIVEPATGRITILDIKEASASVCMAFGPIRGVITDMCVDEFDVIVVEDNRKVTSFRIPCTVSKSDGSVVTNTPPVATVLLDNTSIHGVAVSHHKSVYVQTDQYMCVFPLAAIVRVPVIIRMHVAPAKHVDEDTIADRLTEMFKSLSHDECAPGSAHPHADLLRVTFSVTVIPLTVPNPLFYAYGSIVLVDPDTITNPFISHKDICQIIKQDGKEYDSHANDMMVVLGDTCVVVRKCDDGVHMIGVLTLPPSVFEDGCDKVEYDSGAIPFYILDSVDDVRLTDNMVLLLGRKDDMLRVILYSLPGTGQYSVIDVDNVHPDAIGPGSHSRGQRSYRLLLMHPYVIGVASPDMDSIYCIRYKLETDMDAGELEKTEIPPSPEDAMED